MKWKSLIRITLTLMTLSTASAGTLDGSLSIPKVIKTPELFKRPLYDMAKSPKNAAFIVSAGGVYRRLGKELWEELPHFQSTNPPVAFDQDGTLYVGSSLSFDDGLNFEPFIRWDEVLKAIRVVSNKAPRFLRLEKIIPKNLKILIQLDAGWDQMLLLSTKDQGGSWQFESFQTRDASVFELETSIALDRRHAGLPWERAVKLPAPRPVSTDQRL